MNNREKEINAYHDGIEEGVEMYAHWKDGCQYVGTTGKTLAKAFELLRARREKDIAYSRDREIGSSGSNTMSDTKNTPPPVPPFRPQQPHF